MRTRRGDPPRPALKSRKNGRIRAGCHPIWALIHPRTRRKTYRATGLYEPNPSVHTTASRRRFRRPLWAVALMATAWVLSAGWTALGITHAQSAPAAATAARADATSHAATIDRYCVSCHNARTRAGGLV